MQILGGREQNLKVRMYIHECFKTMACCCFTQCILVTNGYIHSERRLEFEWFVSLVDGPMHHVETSPCPLKTFQVLNVLALFLIFYFHKEEAIIQFCGA